MSSIPGLLGQKGCGQKRKKPRRKTIGAAAGVADGLPDVTKSAEYKAFEAFLVASQGLGIAGDFQTLWLRFPPPSLPPPPGQSILEDTDLTGQEDPVILHAVIATLPSQTAHKEGESIKGCEPNQEHEHIIINL